MGFQKQKPKIITYHRYKTFDNEKFRSDVLKRNFNKNGLGSDQETFFNLFNKHVTLKKICPCQ